MDFNFTLAGKTKVTPPSAVSSGRYKFMSLSEAEPNLGLPDSTGFYFLTSDITGQRGWSIGLPDVNFDFIDAIEVRTNWLSSVSAYIQDLDVIKLKALTAHIETSLTHSLTAAVGQIDYLDVDFSTGFTVQGDLNIDTNLTVGQNITANDAYFDILEANHIKAVTKSFLVNHPTKKDKKLHYGSLESPYHGIRLTGKDKIIKGECVVNLPEYIANFVAKEDVNIQITNYQHNKVLYVDRIDIDNNNFVVKLDGVLNKFSDYEFFWSFTAIRKDVEKLIVEE